MRLTRGTFEGPILASLPAVSSPAEFRFVCESNQLQVSINGAAYVPIATGGGASPWQQVGTTVTLVDPLVTNVTAAIAGQVNGSIQFNVVQQRGGPLGAFETVSALGSSVRGDPGDDATSIIHAYRATYSSNGGAATSIALMLDGFGGDPFDLALFGQENPLVLQTTCRSGVTSPISLVASDGVTGFCEPGSGILLQTGRGGGGATGQGGDIVAGPGAAGVGSANRGGDLRVIFGAGDGAGRGGRMAIDRIEAVPNAGGTAGPYNDKLTPGRFGGVFLEGGAIAVTTSAGAFAVLTGAWSGTLGSRGDVVTDFATPRLRLGASGGVWEVTWSLTIEAVDADTYTFAADFGFLTLTRGSAAHSMGAGDVANFSSKTVFAPPPATNPDVRIAQQSVGGGDILVRAGSLFVKRIA